MATRNSLLRNPLVRVTGKGRVKTLSETARRYDHSEGLTDMIVRLSAYNMDLVPD